MPNMRAGMKMYRVQDAKDNSQHTGGLLSMREALEHARERPDLYGNQIRIYSYKWDPKAYNQAMGDLVKEVKLPSPHPASATGNFKDAFPKGRGSRRKPKRKTPAKKSSAKLTRLKKKIAELKRLTRSLK